MKLAVIGAGLIGAAAARHLAGQGLDVTLIGPGEPSDPATHTGPFASHYDEGRITRGLDPDLFWSRASRASLARYADIEAASGIRFYSQVGCLMAGPEDSPDFDRMTRVAERDAIACESYYDAILAARFPYFHFDPGSRALFEPLNAGHISPRALLRAQIALATRSGARHLTDTVNGLDDTPTGVTLTTTGGKLTFDRVLVATGGFSRDLLANQLPLTVYGRTVVLFRLPDAEAQRLSTMPSLIYLDPPDNHPYLLPPIRYPDGHTYLKMGGPTDDPVLDSPAAITDWFRSDGAPDAPEVIEALTRARIPDLRVAAIQPIPCVTTYTPDERPCLTALSERVFTAIGGCGRAAKNSDELGRLGALLLTGAPLPDWANPPG